MVLLMALTAVACRGKDGQAPERESLDAVAQTGESGESAETPARIVSMSPNLTQIIFALGADDLLVGVDEYSVYPPAAAELPRMGSYMDPDLEALIASRPDLVLTVETDEGLGDKLKGLGIEYREFRNDTVLDVLESIESLGWLLNKKDKAEELSDDFLNASVEIRHALDGTERTRVALVVGRNTGRLQDIFVVGSGSFLSELLEFAGGENVFADQAVSYPQVGVESLIGADPDVIIDSTLAKGASEEEFVKLKEDWNSLAGLKAVRNGKIIVAREGWFQIPGAYMGSTIRLFAHWLHPDVFPEEVNDPNM